MKATFTHNGISVTIEAEILPQETVNAVADVVFGTKTLQTVCRHGRGILVNGEHMPLIDYKNTGFGKP